MILQSHLIEELSQISQQLTNSTLESLAHSLGVDEYYPSHSEGTIIYSKITNQPVRCKLCNSCDKWLREGAVFVCDHTREYDLPLRVVDSIRVDKVYIKDVTHD